MPGPRRYLLRDLVLAAYGLCFAAAGTLLAMRRASDRTVFIVIALGALGALLVAAGLAGEGGENNSRNGYGRKSVVTDTGRIAIESP